MIRFAHGASTDVGRVRSLNEDSLLVADTLFAVADGMGGHRGGEVASATALESLRTAVLEPSIESLVEAVHAANRVVFDDAQTNADLAGMGTTLCAIALVRDGDTPSIGIVNVGDSRVYLLDGERFDQLSEDHSLVETMVRGGQLSADEALVHPGRNVLTRGLGIEPQVDVDCWTVALKTGDRFLLCSDGLFNELHDDQIAAVLRRLSDPTEATDELVRLARESGGRDNITAVVVDVVDDEGVSAAGEIDDRLTRVSDEHDDFDEGGDPRDPTSPVPTLTPSLPEAIEPDPLPPIVTPVIRPADRGRTRRFTWRTGVFILAIVAVIGVGFGAVVYAARSTYFVKLDGGQVAIFKGRPGGLLWFDPTRVENTSIKAKDVPGKFIDDLEDGHTTDSLTAAHTYVANIRRAIAATSPTPTTTSTTLAGATPPTSTTSLPGPTTSGPAGP